MGVTLQGNSGTNAEVESTSRALRVTPKPVDYGSLGIYSMGAASGTMAAGLAANSPIVSYRWTHATNLAVIKRVRFSAGDTSTAFTAGLILIQLFAARSFSASDTGGTAWTTSGNNGKLRTSMATSLVGDIRASSTATLSAGTRTLDTQPLASLSSSIVATAGTPLFTSGLNVLFEAKAGDYPFVLAQNEGFVIQATVPATGTWQFSVDIQWEELSAYVP